ncbi:MAG: aldehyde dehydrogenase [Oscillospiraceae bacterium]|jgi:propionaldehyde dehydrogenase|nr:aldehyde dehydrogenase [Oscillospiraceae bacterium]
MERMMGMQDERRTAGSAADVRADAAGQAVSASRKAYREYAALSLAYRRAILAAVKSRLVPLVPDMAARELDETGMGSKRDKIVKLMLAIHKTPGVEDLITEVITGDDGMTLCEYSAYGVICAVQPGTNPCATLINNTIGMLAAGNSVIHIPHPRCLAVSQFAVRHIDEAIREVCGIQNLVASLSESSMLLADEIMSHPDVAMVVATGGGRMLGKALSNAKRVIGAGQANPVAIVDETADLEKAARDIVDGASFDHNIMCTSEKNIVVVSAAADAFVEALRRQDVCYVNSEAEMLALTKATVTADLLMNRALEGKSANAILDAAGIRCDRAVRLIVVDTVKTHPFVTLEMLMPLVPLVRVKDFDAALETALFIEQELRHTAVIHSRSVDRLNRAAQIMQTSVFVKNGPSLVGLGLNGEGNTSFTVANLTGEGVTTARHFARRRRCTLTSGFSIR